MAKYNTYEVEGRWEEGTDVFAVLFSDDSWDGVEDAEDERIFYYTDGEPVKVGDVVADGFVITNVNKKEKQ